MGNFQSPEQLVSKPKTPLVQDLRNILFLGDPKFKPYVTGDPDYISVPLNGGEDFLVVASDGLWDCVNDDEIASNVYHQIATNPGKS